MSSDLGTVIEMESQGCANVTDNTDDVLEKLYEKHCLLSIPKDEVTRIQHAVEIMVRFLLISIYENTPFNELIGSYKTFKRTISSFKTPPNIPYAFNDENLLKVGSYYENTKNHYPDEFDFICVLAECEKSEYFVMKDLTSVIADVFHTCLKMVVSKPFLAGTCIEFVKYVRLHGPAARLEFQYSHSSVDQRSIFVDISPASKVFTQSTVPSAVNDIIPYPEWKEIIRAKGSFLLLKVFRAGHPKHETQIKISATESEQYYILEDMSDNHKRVYRLLKYILSNDSIGETLRELMRSEENQTSVVCYRVFYPRVVYDFPSYVIKTIMFHHCHTCKGSGTISGCAVNVLTYILKQISSEQKRKLRLRCLKFGIPRSFSVSVETMTGEKIEIADSHDSSMKIKKYLKEIRNDILQNEVTEQIPLAKKMVPVVEKHRKKRENRKICVRCTCKRCVYGLVILLIYALLLGWFILSRSHVQRRMCWNGTDYIGNVNYTSIDYFNTSDLNLFDPTDVSTVPQDNLTAVTATQNTYCLAYNNIVLNENRANMSVAIVNKIFHCGDRSFCNIEDKMYQIKVVKRGTEQQLVCSARQFASRIESDYLSSDVNCIQKNMESYGKHLACLQTETACLNMKEKHYLFGRFLSENALGCDKNQTCMHAFPNETVNLGCYISKHINESDGAMQTEICCCDRHACVDPEKDEDEILVGTIFIIIVMIAFIATEVLCLFGCCCLDARLEYCMHTVKRKLRVYRMS